tara:strand:- start:18 stop:860 length:843 start_codon:yes stop_codon:yes gene_type:complete
MFVKKYKLLNNLTGNTAYNINVPVGNNSGLVGQQEVIERDFVNIEVDKAVNIIFDYEKVKVLPISNSDTIVNNITYKVNLLNSTATAFNTGLKWADIGFNDDDLRFKKNSFIKSFLRLDFYDSDIVSNQNLISFITLFPKFSHNDMIDGTIPSANSYQVNFVLGNPLVDRKKNGEGFSLYHFKDEILPDPLPPKNLYMRATFNNAKEGTSTGLMSSNSLTLNIDDLISSTEGTTVENNLYTKYVLFRDETGYFYKIDTNYSGNVNESGGYNINLYQINAI